MGGATVERLIIIVFYTWAAGLSIGLLVRFAYSQLWGEVYRPPQVMR